jgi:hypothetical protein
VRLAATGPPVPSCGLVVRPVAFALFAAGRQRIECQGGPMTDETLTPLRAIIAVVVFAVGVLIGAGLAAWFGAPQVRQYPERRDPAFKVTRRLGCPNGGLSMGGRDIWTGKAADVEAAIASGSGKAERARHE